MLVGPTSVVPSVSRPQLCLLRCPTYWSWGRFSAAIGRRELTL